MTEQNKPRHTYFTTRPNGEIDPRDFESTQIEAEQKKEIIDIIMDILKNKAWTLREVAEMTYSELKEKGYIRLK